MKKRITNAEVMKRALELEQTQVNNYADPELRWTDEPGEDNKPEYEVTNYPEESISGDDPHGLKNFVKENFNKYLSDVDADAIYKIISSSPSTEDESWGD